MKTWIFVARWASGTWSESIRLLLPAGSELVVERVGNTDDERRLAGPEKALCSGLDGFDQVPVHFKRLVRHFLDTKLANRYLSTVLAESRA